MMTDSIAAAIDRDSCVHPDTHTDEECVVKTTMEMVTGQSSDDYTSECH